MLGSLKEEVLITLAANGPDVLIGEVHAAIDNARKKERGKGLSFASVFNTIQRLEDEKMLNTGKGPIHRGKPMVTYTISAKGERALNAADAVREKLKKRQAPVLGGTVNV